MYLEVFEKILVYETVWVRVGAATNKGAENEGQKFLALL